VWNCGEVWWKIVQRSDEYTCSAKVLWEMSRVLVAIKQRFGGYIAEVWYVKSRGQMLIVQRFVGISWV
jgi:hypothetical protein